MIYRTFADTGIDISILSLGTVKIGRNTGVKYPTSFDLPSDEQVIKLLQCARELGINAIDTAPAYGTSEERLGQIIPRCGIPREQWILSSKLGEEFDAVTVESSYDFTPEWAEKSLQRSLARLGTDYLDMLMIHSDGNDLDAIKKHGLLDKLNEFKQRGLVRAVGASTKTVEGGLYALEKSDCVMCTYNLQSDDEEPVLAAAAKLNKGAFIKKAFASGHLDATQGDPVQQSFDFVLAHPGVTSIVSGTLNTKHLRENVEKAMRAINN